MFTGKRKPWTLTMLAALMIVVSACAPNREEASSPAESIASATASSQETPKPKQLVVWANDDANQLAAVEQIAQKYTEEKGIEVVIERVSGAEQVQKLALAAPSGKGPDLFYQPQDRLGDLVTQGLVEPLAWDDAALAGYSKAAIDAVRYEGKVYGAPISIETYALYYNKNLVPNQPATMEDATKAGQAILDPKSDKYGFLVVPDFYYSIPFISNYGGYIFGGEPGNYTASDIGLNNDGAVEGLTQFQQFYQQNAIPETLTIDIMDSLFMEGKAGMVVNGLWAMKKYGDQYGDKLGTAPLPAVNGKASPSFVGVKSWFISSYSESFDWAADLAGYLTNDDSAKLYHEKTGEIPARTAVMDQVTDPLYQGFIEQINSGIPMPNIPEMSAVWEMDNALDFIIKGGEAKSILDESVDKINQQIAASGK